MAAIQPARRLGGGGAGGGMGVPQAGGHWVAGGTVACPQPGGPEGGTP
jgi:hypothetical protein